MTAVRALGALAACALLPGCIAAIPAGAVALMGREHVMGGDRSSTPAPVSPPAPATLPEPATLAAPPASSAKPAAVPPAMQYLYGSGEAAALSVQSYQALWSYLQARVADRAAGRDLWSVVLSSGATLAEPRFMPCGKKKMAVVLDIDETALLNLGFEADDAHRAGPYDAGRWDRWEKTGGTAVSAVPGASEALSAARRAGIAVVYNSNRSAANAADTAAALDHAGLGPAVHGDTLWLRGDDDSGSAKDARRRAISEKYCVVALVGDQLGDFSDLFNAPGLATPVRRNAATETMIAPLWGLGWFILPNPVYGSALQGGFGDVFPMDKGWTDPAEER